MIDLSTPTVPRMGVQVDWTGPGGDVWHLTDYHNSPVIMVNQAVSGFGNPQIDHRTQDIAGLHGSRWRGWNAKARQISVPVLVWSGEGSQWTDVAERWWSSIKPDVEGTLTVTTPTGRCRHILARADTGDDSFDRDPSSAGWAFSVAHLLATDPFWVGEPISMLWSNKAGVNWLGGGAPSAQGSATPFYIMPGGLGGATVITNSGDVPAWPLWTVTGPCESVSLAVDEAVIAAPIHLADGQQMVIDSDPRRQTVIVDGVDRISELTSAVFQPIPAGADRHLTLHMEGTGSVEVEISPKFLRAW